jgi:hypothetical protein
MAAELRPETGLLARRIKIRILAHFALQRLRWRCETQPRLGAFLDAGQDRARAKRASAGG